MNDEVISSLEDLGLSQKEARVYLANLSIGPASVQKIADVGAIKRVTTYVILESLVNLGLVSQSTKGKKTFFTAEDPVSLKRLLKKKEEQLKEQKVNFEAVLPQLKTLQNLPVDSPSVKFYDSPEGIRSIMASFLTIHKDEPPETVYGVTNLDQLYAFFPEIKDEGVNPDRVQSGLSSKIIYTGSQGPIYRREDPDKNREARYVPHDQFPLNGDLTIVGDHVIMLSLSGSKPIGITIQSRELAQSFLAWFKLAWEAAGRYGKRE